MKAIAYLLMLAGFGWGLIIATTEFTSAGSAAPVAALLGAGFGLLTIHSVRIGSIRGHGRRISRDQQPVAYWFAVAISSAVAAVLLASSLLI